MSLQRATINERQTINHGKAGNGGVLFFQPKLSVNQPNDVYEQEGDVMADKVMRMPAHFFNDTAFFKPASSNLQRKCHDCEVEDKMLHRKESSVNEVKGSNHLDSYVASLGSSGQPLPETSRKFFEPRFGHDFSNVRIHNDAVAAKSAQSINALAYTTGNNIVFNQGQYALDSEPGLRLMAHELTHVVQQGDSDTKIQKQGGTGTPIIDHGDFSQIPPEVKLSCRTKDQSPADQQRIYYGSDSYELDNNTRIVLDDFVLRWNKAGANKSVRIDGYASTTGDEPLNWRLSCLRTDSVQQELMNPYNGVAGIPENFISRHAHGQTNRFSQDEFFPNQTATITSDIKVKPDHVDPDPEHHDPKNHDQEHHDPVVTKSDKTCGPDITDALAALYPRVEDFFNGLSSDDKKRSCRALDLRFLLAWVMPSLTWETWELFLDNTAWLDSYAVSNGCGTPKDPACAKDESRKKCESPDTCDNTVVVDGKCMLAGTANYGIYGKMFKLCHDEFSPSYSHFDMDAVIVLWKTLDKDDALKPMAMAGAVFDGTFPSVPSAAENRGDCKERCGVKDKIPYQFVWEPFKKR
jgi:outer membrane protein OmpA-like peptidoglycan-associated protein